MFKQKHSPIKVAIVFIAVFMLCGLVDATAAEEAGHKESEESQRHRLGLFPGYTYIHEAAEDVGAWEFIPTAKGRGFILISGPYF